MVSPRWLRAGEAARPTIGMAYSKATQGAERQQRPSKSQCKRDAMAMQKLAETLVRMAPKQRCLLPLPVSIMDAISIAAMIQKRAFRRQIRYIAGLLQTIDIIAVNNFLERTNSGSGALTAHKRTTVWCTRLIEYGDAAITELITDYPDVDRNQLYQRVRNAKRKSADPLKASRMLYPFVRALDPD